MSRGGRFIARWNVVVTLLASLAASSTGAAGPIPELRIATTWRGPSDVTTYSAAWYTPAPRWTRADRLEMSLGVIDDDASSRGIAFVGPSWRLGKFGAPPFVDFSIGPTILSGSTVGGRELGGNIHFRSALAFGLQFGVRRDMEIALRVSHVSNGGLRDANPGLDSIGLSFVGGIGAR